MADEVLDGSCLCGAVRYRVRGPFMRFVHCHCSRCRKATGSGHATNLIAEPANLEWIAGRDQTQRFDLPSAKSFATAVCRTCRRPCHGSAATASAPSYPPDRSILPPAFSRLPEFFGSPGRRGVARGMSCIAFPSTGIGCGGLKDMGFFFQFGPDSKISLSLLSGRHPRSLTVNKRFDPFVSLSTT